MILRLPKSAISCSETNPAAIISFGMASVIAGLSANDQVIVGASKIATQSTSAVVKLAAWAGESNKLMP